MNNVVENSKTSSKKSITAKQLAKSNLTKRKNPDWDNLDRGYRYLTLDMKLPHDQTIAVMGNVVEESLGNYKATLKNGNGKGLIQWDGREAPNGRYGLWGSIWASVAKPANVYDATTDTMKNYWAPWRGLKGDKVRLEFIKAPLKQKILIYAESYLRPGKPRIADRQLSAMQLDSIYNPRIKNIIVQKQGGQIRKMQTAAGGPIHYSRAMTANNLSKAANYVGEYILKGLGALGKIMTTPLTGGPLGTTSVVLPKTKKLLDAERKIREIQELLIERVSTWLSPLNYGAALTTGNGLNAKKGEEEVASWSPAWQAAARLGELYVGPKGVKTVKATPRVVVNTAAKAGSKTAKKVAIAREIKLGIKLNTKNGKIEVSPEYFKAEDKWYRLSERPEKIGIEEQGKNITTHDDPEIPGTIGNWRSTMLDNRRGLNGKGKRIVPRPDNGFVLEEGMNFAKHGQAHGNTSQAAKGLIWGGTFAFSNRFPGGIIEGQAPNKIFRGMTVEGKDSRSNFVLLNWEDVPIGARVGFHTGEMPMENLGWFQKTKNDTYTYEPIIPEKRITIESSDNWTLNLPGKRDYSISRKPSYSGYTPTKLNPSLAKFVRDVMLGYKWGRNREVKPIGNKDFTQLLEGKERMNFGAETSVYEDTSNPSQVLKVYPNGSNGFSTPLIAIQEGLNFIGPLNNRPYNLPTNLEGTVKRHGSYFPVFSQRKVYIPLIMLPKINDFDRSVHGMYSYFGKPDVNNILSENDIPLALDFKLDNIGLLSDGTVMGIDLWKQGGKMNILEFLKNGSGIHIKKKNRGKYFKSINKYVNV